MRNWSCSDFPRSVLSNLENVCDSCLHNRALQACRRIDITNSPHREMEEMGGHGILTELSHVGRILSTSAFVQNHGFRGASVSSEPLSLPAGILPEKSPLFIDP